MMLYIRLCTDRKRNSETLLDTICENAAQGRGGQILLVPEQFSHRTERRLCERGGDQISRYAEVLGFSRLANRVFSTDGGCAESETDAVGRLLMMSLAVEQVQSRLKIYGISAARPEFLLQLQDAFDEFQSFCVTPERLRQASERLDGVLAEKTEEFALLMESFDAVSKQMGQNPQTRLTRLLEALETSRFIEGKRFYFDGFTDFNGVEYEIIAALLNRGAEITVALQCDSEESPRQQFAAARQTLKSLCRIARQQGEAAKIIRLPVGEETQPLSYLRGSVFSGMIVPYPKKQEQIRKISGADATEQCRTAAGEILRLISEGVRWRDISVACANYDTLRPMLESQFRRAEIPAYFAGDTDILRQNVVHMLLTALDAACGSMDTETVLSYLKSGFVLPDRERCDRLENYVLLWRISGSRWEKPWTMNPDGFRSKPDERSQARLQQIENDRVLAISPLLRLRKALKNAPDTAQMVLAVYAFTQEIGLEQTLNRLAQERSDAGDLQKSQEYVQIYGILCDLLEQMYGVLGQSVRSPENFYRMFRTALSQSKVGTIPASLDCVTVGSLMSQRRCDTDYVMVLGAEEGLFPCAQGSGGLLTDGERLSLRELGVDLAPTAAGALDRELAAIDSVLNAAGKCLYLGAADGKEAYLLRRAFALFPDADSLQGDKELIRRSKREYLSYLASVPGMIGENAGTEDVYGKAKELLNASQYRVENLSEEAVKRLYGQTLSLSSSKIDTLASCRFCYFLQYGLRAQKRETAEVDPRLYGTFVHDVLEHTARQVMQEGGFETLPLDRVLKIAEERMEYYAKQELADLWESSRAEYLFRRNFAEVRLIVTDLYQEMSASKFRPQWFELHFADHGGTLPSVSIVGEKMSAKLEGFVDRADIWRDGDRVFVRVVDYKTNKKTFDYTMILNGLLLQMLLYLFALESSGQELLDQPLQPAGVLYFEAKAETTSLKNKLDDREMEKSRKKQKKRSGIVLDRETVLQAMEPCDDEPVYLPYEHNKEGERVGSLFTSEQMHALQKHVYQTVAALGDDLYSGDIAPNPYVLNASSGACNYCPYDSVCRGKGEERWLKRVKSPKEFWAAIGEEKADG